MLEKYSMNQKNKNQQRNLLTPENALIERTCQQSIHKYMKNRQFSRPSAEGGRPSAEVEKSFRPSAERSASAEGRHLGNVRLLQKVKNPPSVVP